MCPRTPLELRNASCHSVKHRQDGVVRFLRDASGLQGASELDEIGGPLCVKLDDRCEPVRRAGSTCGIQHGLEVTLQFGGM
jgi:hypothetical protein